MDSGESVLMFGVLDGLDYEKILVLAKQLKTNKTVHKLVLNQNQVGDLGAEALGKSLERNRHLQELHLQHAGINSVGAYKLATALKSKHQQLRSLVLSFNDIRDRGAEAIARALPKNRTLENLDLSFNVVGNDGAEALAEGLCANKTLRSLVLCFNRFGSRGMSSFGRALKVNDTLGNLNIMGNRIRGNELSIVALARAGLKDNRALRELHLSDHRVRAQEGAMIVCQAVQGHANLRILELANFADGDAAARVLERALQTDTLRLTELSMCHTRLTNSGAAILANALRKNARLTKLDIGTNDIGDKGCGVIAKALRTNGTLIELLLVRNKISDIGAMELASMLRENSVLESLDLTRNAIGSQGSEALLAVFQEMGNETLTQLSLRYQEDQGVTRKLFDFYLWLNKVRFKKMLRKETTWPAIVTRLHDKLSGLELFYQLIRSRPDVVMFAAPVQH